MAIGGSGMSADLTLVSSQGTARAMGPAIASAALPRSGLHTGTPPGVPG
jgi:hypothetical protein